MLPLCDLRPCVAAMASLAEQFRSTLVLCTATQPSLGDLLHTYAPSYPITELCPQTAEEYDSFRRVTFRQEGILEDDVLAEKLSEHRQVLCIVNSRKAAQSIFARLPQEASFHLSTLMVPAQRQTLLDEIRAWTWTFPRCTASWLGWIPSCRRRGAATARENEHRRKASSPSSSGQNCRQCCSAQQSALRAKH